MEDCLSKASPGKKQAYRFVKDKQYVTLGANLNSSVVLATGKDHDHHNLNTDDEDEDMSVFKEVVMIKKKLDCYSTLPIKGSEDRGKGLSRLPGSRRN